jgi:hypothetical protein
MNIAFFLRSQSSIIFKLFATGAMTQYNVCNTTGFTITSMRLAMSRRETLLEVPVCKGKRRGGMDVGTSLKAPNASSSKADELQGSPLHSSHDRDSHQSADGIFVVSFELPTIRRHKDRI